MHHETDFIKYVLQEIAKGNNNPTLLNKKIDEFLNNNYSNHSNNKRGGRFSDKEIIGIRSGICSRLSELNFIHINIDKNKTHYSVSERGNIFLRGDN